MRSEVCYFGVEGEVLVPQPAAASSWADGQTVRGMASSAVMARAAERAVGSDFRPARWTADLSRPVPMSPLRTRAEVLRRGRRVCLVDVELLTGEVIVARARGLFVHGGAEAPGKMWEPTRDLALPPAAVAEGRLYYSEPAGWTTDSDPHQNAARKQIWLGPVAVVDTEAPSPFQSAAAIADLASVVTHWGDAGLPFINADLTLALARLPTGPGLGVSALERVESDGIAIGTALIHDQDGVLGTSTVTAMINSGLIVNPGRRDTVPS